MHFFALATLFSLVAVATATPAKIFTESNSDSNVPCDNCHLFKCTEDSDCPYYCNGCNKVSSNMVVHCKVLIAISPKALGRCNQGVPGFTEDHLDRLSVVINI